MLQKIVIPFIVLILISCNNWLDVSPEDKVLEDDVYSSESGVNSVLNGIYMNMAQNNLYGRKLSATTLELLALSYYITPLNKSESDRFTVEYKYYEPSVKSVFSSIWSDVYLNILNVNIFIEKLSNLTFLTKERKDILLGEAYGLRAFMHFDLLRLFGPIYSEDSDQLAIPYYIKAQGAKSAILPAKEVVENIFKDITEAELLLQNDPIRTEGVLRNPSGNSNTDFYRLRNRRFNYFAVKMLKSRLLLYSGKNTEASDLAKQIIEETRLIFPFAASEKVTHYQYQDRKLSDEVIFEIENIDLKRLIDSHFLMSLNQNNGAYLFRTELLKYIFDLGTNQALSQTDDYRNTYWETYHFSGTGSGAATQEFQITTRYSVGERMSLYKYTQPLMRKAELYYIIAEVENSTSYVDSIRMQRGITTKTVGNVDAEIQKEYIREMYGEGQLFFYYKRKNTPSIIDGTKNMISNSPQMRAMNKENYLVPIPESEFKD